MAILLFACLPSGAWASSVRVILPDRSTTLSVITASRQPYVDARAVVALVSGELRTDSARDRVSLLIGPRTFTLRRGSSEALVADQAVTLSSPPVFRDGRVLLPLEIVPLVLAERYGQGAVEWAPNQRVARVRAREATIAKIRVGSYPTHTRVVLETVSRLEWSVQQADGGSGLQILVPGGVLDPSIRPLTLRTGVVRSVQPAQRVGGAEIRLLCEGRPAGVRTFTLSAPDRIVIDVLSRPPQETRRALGGEARDAQSPPVAPSAATQPSIGSGSPVAAKPTPGPTAIPEPINRGADASAALPSDRQEGAIRTIPPAGSGNGGSPPRESSVLTVVLDPGHGGYDTGAVGPSGLQEKDVVLDLALRLRRLLQERLGVRVIMTRAEDVFVPLPERTAIANQAKADFFLSLHVNGAAKRGAVGFETFYFTREPSDNDARASAQRENLVIESDGARGKDQESLLRITLADMAVTRDMRESGELAELVLTSLDKLLKVENRGVKSGPFYVLATAAMPAILVEGAFITNPKEERKLQQDAYRQRVAEALYEGIAKYKVRYERRVGAGAPVAAGS